MKGRHVQTEAEKQGKLSTTGRVPGHEEPKPFSASVDFTRSTYGFRNETPNDVSHVVSQAKTSLPLCSFGVVASVFLASGLVQRQRNLVPSCLEPTAIQKNKALKKPTAHQRETISSTRTKRETE